MAEQTWAFGEHYRVPLCGARLHVRAPGGLLQDMESLHLRLYFSRRPLRVSYAEILAVVKSGNVIF